MEPRFFKSALEFRKWLGKNFHRSKELWVGFYKPHSFLESMTQSEAVDQALCYGWIYGVIKRIDDSSYKIRFVPRKPKSEWGHSMIRRVEALKKLGIMKKPGLEAFKNRDKKSPREKPPVFSKEQLRLFKANQRAWSFFNQQTPSYQRYTMWWVISAKQPQTRMKRLKMLIEDSGRESKLARILAAQEKVKHVFEPGQTPIEEGKNIGRVCGAELRTLGINTLEQLQELGWEEAAFKLCEHYPHRANMNMILSLIGATEGKSRLKLEVGAKARAKNILRELKNSFR